MVSKQGNATKAIVLTQAEFSNCRSHPTQEMNSLIIHGDIFRTVLMVNMVREKVKRTMSATPKRWTTLGLKLLYHKLSPSQLSKSTWSPSVVRRWIFVPQLSCGFNI